MLIDRDERRESDVCDKHMENGKHIKNKKNTKHVRNAKHGMEIEDWRWELGGLSGVTRGSRIWTWRMLRTHVSAKKGALYSRSSAYEPGVQ